VIDIHGRSWQPRIWRFNTTSETAGCFKNSVAHLITKLQ